MKYGVHRVTWGGYYDQDNVEEFFAQVKSTGAETVEMRPTDAMLMHKKKQIQEIRNLAEDAGLELLFSFGFPEALDMRSPDLYIRQYAVDHLIKAIESIAMAGGKEFGGAGIYSGWPTHFQHDLVTPEAKYERTMRSIECMRKAAPVAEELGVMLNFEILNRFENYILNTVEEGISYCSQIESKNCGLLLDTFHMSMEEDDLEGAIEKAGDLIGQFHVTEPNRGIPFHTKRINWPEIGRALKRIGYDKTVTIEAAVAFEGEATYNLRMWRNLLPDISLESRLNALREGLCYIRAQFED
ncbi:sugar phosphate isomerase/epimerase family protein [Anaerolentibacter hominis]|uniref:sugar phosphate isomerase/epimerase family protein n=1 Tax=Anaerolentibacter hominis TaxID=3079009 RepID=UPI0031B83DB0